MSKRLTQLSKESLSYCDPSLKKAFHNAGKAALRKVAQEMGLSTNQRDIRSCMGGIAVAGEVILHTEEVYVQIHQDYTGKGRVMYRRCQGRRDYSGGANQFAPIEELEDPKAFAEKLQRLIAARRRDYYNRDE